MTSKIRRWVYLSYTKAWIWLLVKHLQLFGFERTLRIIEWVGRRKSRKP